MVEKEGPKLGSTGGSAGEVGAISRLKTEDDKFRALIENSPKFSMSCSGRAYE